MGFRLYLGLYQALCCYAYSQPSQDAIPAAASSRSGGWATRDRAVTDPGPGARQRGLSGSRTGRLAGGRDGPLER